MDSVPETVRLRLEVRGPRHRGPASFLDWFEDVSLVATVLETGVEKVLFCADLELGPLHQWLSDNEQSIRHDPPVLPQRRGETIGLTLLRAKQFFRADLSDEIIDLIVMPISNYDESHRISTSSSHMKTSPVLLGVGNAGHEVCNWIGLDEKATPWHFRFDIDDFFDHLPQFDFRGGDTGAGLTLSPKAGGQSPPPDYRLRLEARRRPEHPARLALIATDLASNTATTLVETDSDDATIGSVVSWLRASESSIREQTQPIERREGETLGEVLARAQASTDTALPDDVRFLTTKALSDYVSTHDIGSVLSGSTSGPPLLMGRVDGPGINYFEICNRVDGEYANNEPWSIRFDPDDFFAHLPVG
ncbi:hypothetical protein ACWDTD_17685 [Gordonia sp. NPDC003425]